MQKTVCLLSISINIDNCTCFAADVDIFISTLITIRQLDNIETFKKKLKTFIFSETFDLETKTIRHSFAT